jgi:ATP-binding cassette, subfamily B, bacterial
MTSRASALAAGNGSARQQSRISTEPRPKIPLRLLRTLQEAWRASPWALLAMGLSAMLAGLAPTGMSWYARNVLDGVARSDRVAVVAGIAAEACFLFLTYAAGGLNQFASGRLRLRLGFSFQQAILNKSMTVPYAHFEDPRFYDALTRARREALTRPISLVSGLFVLVQTLAVLVGSAALMFRFSPFCALAIVCAAMPSFFSETRFALALFQLQNRRATEAREQAYFEQVLTRDDHAKEVRLFGTGPNFLARVRRIFSIVFEEDQSLARRRLLIGLGTDFFALVLFYGVYVYVAYRAVQGTLSIGDLGLALVAFRQGDGALKMALNTARALHLDHQYLGNVYDFLDTPVVTPKQRLLPAAPRDELGLRFERVGFNYPGATNPALKGVDFYLAPGQKLALVGNNGSGKSTILKLIAGLYQPTEGRIWLDGVDLAAWDPEKLHARLAVVFQDFVRYQLTVRENVALREDEHVSDAAIHQALQRSEVMPVVERLPGKMQQRLGKLFSGGVELSGGEWQKLALARAFLRIEADLLLFDEPTAAIDPAAEAALFDRVRAETQGRMAILVSHRFSTVRIADEILVLHAGQVIERGSHEALVQARGRYATMFELQAAGYR